MKSSQASLDFVIESLTRDTRFRVRLAAGGDARHDSVHEPAADHELRGRVQRVLHRRRRRRPARAPANRRVAAPLLVWGGRERRFRQMGLYTAIPPMLYSRVRPFD